MNTGKIIESNTIQNAAWRPEDGVLIVGHEAHEQNLLHEMIHYHQYLPPNCLHACREWQAYLIGEIMRCVSERLPKGATPVIGIPSDELMAQLCSSCGMADGHPTIDQSLYDYIISMNYEETVNAFMEYWKKIDEKNDPKQYTNYYDGFDTTYDWAWDSLLKKLGIQIGTPKYKAGYTGD